jgi:hypothetical protein
LVIANGINIQTNMSEIEGIIEIEIEGRFEECVNILS